MRLRSRCRRSERRLVDSPSLLSSSSLFHFLQVGLISLLALGRVLFIMAVLASHSGVRAGDIYRRIRIPMDILKFETFTSYNSEFSASAPKLSCYFYILLASTRVSRKSSDIYRRTFE